MRLFLVALLAGCAFLLPNVSFAAETDFFGPLYPDACKCDTATLGYESAPEFGCVVIVFQRLINLALSIASVIFVLIITYAGFLFMTSSMNPEAKSKGKSMLLGALIGFIIALSAWLLIDFVMKAIYNPGANFNGTQLGPWNEILTNGEGIAPTCIRRTNQGVIDEGSGGSGDDNPQEGNTFRVGQSVQCDRSNNGRFMSATVVEVPEINLPSSEIVVRYESDNEQQTLSGTRCRSGAGELAPDNSFTGQENQRAHASPALNSLLRCMAGRVPGNYGRISSISDSLIVSGEKTFEECASTGSCAHSRNSCHYGGRNCVGSSYAVDFGYNGEPSDTRQVLSAAANACGASFVLNEGTHLHVSVNNSQCGCN